MNYNKIIKAINEGLDKALMSFDDEPSFDKRTNKRSKTAEYIVYFEEAKKRIASFNKENYQWLLEQYLTDGFLYTVNDKDELENIIDILNQVVGNDCDLNWIDTGKMTDMSRLFFYSTFNGDISKWDVSNVNYMFGMFLGSDFNRDISNWDVHNVKDMEDMFYGSIFNGNILNWDVSNVENMESMFCESNFNGDISNWDVGNVKYMSSMFEGSNFHGDISNWDVSNVIYSTKIFHNCQIPDEYKPKFNKK